MKIYLRILRHKGVCSGSFCVSQPISLVSCKQILFISEIGKHFRFLLYQIMGNLLGISLQLYH